MNWFLLFLILKLLTVVWMAPIDLADTKEVLDNFLIKGFTVVNELDKIGENEPSSSGESLKESFKKVTDELHNSSTEVKQEFKGNEKEEIAVKPETEKYTTDLGNITSEIETSTPKTLIEQNYNKDVSNILEQDAQIATVTFINSEPRNDIPAFVEIITEPYIETITEKPEISLSSQIEVENAKQNISPETSLPSIGSIVKNFPQNLRDHSQDSINNNTNTQIESVQPQKFLFQTSTGNINLLENNSETALNEQSKNVGIYTTASISTIMNNNNEKTSQFPEIFLDPNKTTDDKQTKGSTTQDEDFNSLQYRYSSMPQLEDIAKGLVNKTNETVSTLPIQDSSENIREVLETSPNYLPINYESFMEVEVPTGTKPKQNHTFREAIDSFIADVMEIGSNLGLITNTQTVNKISETNKNLTENIPQAPNQLFITNDTVESIPSLQRSFNSSVEGVEEIGGTSEIPDTSVAQEININSTPMMKYTTSNADSNSEVVQNIEASYWGRSIENLAGSGRDINSTLGKYVENISSIDKNSTENYPESVTEEIIAKTKSSHTIEFEEPSTTMQSSDANVRDVNQAPFVVNHENIEISSNVKILPGNLQILQATNTKPLEEVENISNNRNSISTTQKSQINLNESGLEYTKPKNLSHPVHYEEYIPVTIFTTPKLEETKKSPKSLQQIENDLQTQSESPIVENQTTIVDQKLLEKSVTTEQNPSATIAATEEVGFNTNQAQDLNLYSTTFKGFRNKEEYITTATAEETTTRSHNTLEESQIVFNNFKNNLKALIKNEKVKQEEKHDTNLETSKIETTTTAPTIKNDSSATTLPSTSAGETTTLPKEFEKELQVAVKTLEQTTHQYFEEFQNNLKEALKKFTVWGAEHEKREESTTLKSIITQFSVSNVQMTQSPSTAIENETPTTSKPVKEANVDNFNILKEDAYKIEEPYRSGFINQQFVDNFEETPSTTKSPMEREETENGTKEERTTKNAITFTNIIPVVEEQHSVKKDKDNIDFDDFTKAQTSLKEDLPATSEHDFREEGPTETKEIIIKVEDNSTIYPHMNLESLQKNVSYDSHKQSKETTNELINADRINLVTEQQQKQIINNVKEQEDVKETSAEAVQTVQPMEQVEETIILSSTEANLQKMFKFIEHTETTTATTIRQQQEDHYNTSSTSQTLQPLTKASFMEEQQQQIETTTENIAQTQTAATQEYTSENDSLSQSTTTNAADTEIFSTIIVEAKDETETEAPTTKTYTAPTEVEARSLSLPPPKLEYLHSEDGVEIFYGYSIVKYN